MEDALAPQEFTPALSNGKVLILVVMEDALVLSLLYRYAYDLQS